MFFLLCYSDMLVSFLMLESVATGCTILLICELNHLSGLESSFEHATGLQELLDTWFNCSSTEP